MANINQLVRRKQNLRMALIGLGISAVGGAAWYLSSAQHAGKAAQTQQQKAPPPNMTGVVSQTFDKRCQMRRLQIFSIPPVRRKRS